MSRKGRTVHLSFFVSSGFFWFGNMKACAKMAALVFMSFLLAWRAYIRGKDLDSGKQEHISHFVLSFCASFLYYTEKKKIILDYMKQ